MASLSYTTTPNVGSVEPDTRGAATIRELLDKHRKLDSCAGCHRQIDPPGFALESFDVIGGFRDRYRSIGKGDQSSRKYRNRGIWEYRLGPKVDASGTFAGQDFADIKQFKALLSAQKETLAHAFIEHSLTYATGAGHQYADRLTISRSKQPACETSSKQSFTQKRFCHASIDFSLSARGILPLPKNHRTRWSLLFLSCQYRAVNSSLSPKCRCWLTKSSLMTAFSTFLFRNFVYNLPSCGRDMS